MPTKHRRIAVVEDPELAEALKRAAGKVPHRSRAALLRHLAIIGADQLAGDRTLTAREYLRSIPGVRAPAPGAGGIEEFLRQYPPVPGPADDPHGLSRALEEEREERL